MSSGPVAPLAGQGPVAEDWVAAVVALARSPDRGGAGGPWSRFEAAAARGAAHDDLARGQGVGASGAVYTPPALARWVVGRVGVGVGAGCGGPILDPACGAGVFLLAVAAARRAAAGAEASRSGAAALDGLVGVDLDGAAVRLTRGLLWAWAADPARAEAALRAPASDPTAGGTQPAPGASGSGPRVWQADALSPAGRTAMAQAVAAASTSGPPGPVRVLGNPPWVDAEAQVAADRALRADRTGRFAVCRGAWDLCAPFVQTGVALAAPSAGTVALVLPDKVVSAPWARALRRWTHGVGGRVEAVVPLSGRAGFDAAVRPVVWVVRAGPAAAAAVQAAGDRAAVRWEAGPGAGEGSGDAGRAAGSGTAREVVVGVDGAPWPGFGSAVAAAGTDRAQGAGPGGSGRPASSGAPAPGTSGSAGSAGSAAPGDAVPPGPEPLSDAGSVRGAAPVPPGLDLAQRARAEGWSPLSTVAAVWGAATVAEAYAWREHLEERPDAVQAEGWWPVVNSGTLDPWTALWGRKALRYLKGRWTHPALPDAVLPETRRARAAAPKLVVAGMTRRLEVLCDPHGRWCPAKSTTVIRPHDPDRLHALAGWLASAALDRWYRTTYGGLGFRGGYLRVGPPQLRDVPLPPWDEATWAAVAAAAVACREAAARGDEEGLGWAQRRLDRVVEGGLGPRG